MRTTVPLLLLVAGCAHRRQARDEANYTVDGPGGDWRAVDAGGADYAWFNQTLGATIYSDSNCGSHFQDRPLPDLAKSLVTGIGTVQPTDGRTFALDGREAWVATVPGRLDGVAVHLGVGVLKKDQCSYDVLYVADPSRFDAGYAAFETVLNSLRTGR